MTLEFQQVWGQLIVIYLFLGGLGGACLALAGIALRFPRLLSPASGASNLDEVDAADKATSAPHRNFAFLMAFSGLSFLGIGSLCLVLDLFRLEAIFYFSNPASWVFWGTMFITLALLCGVLLSWMQVAPWLDRLGVRLKSRWVSNLMEKFADWGMRLRRVEAPAAWGCAVFGFSTAFYTGFLVSVAPSIPFWNTPALPLLFLVSAFSTASAYALLILIAMRRFSSNHRRIVMLELGLIGFEIILLLVYFNFATTGTTGARMSAAFLTTSPGFWIGVLIFGLMLPFVIDFTSLLRHAINPRFERAMAFVSAILVLVGGYFLRYYILTAGVFEFPY